MTEYTKGQRVRVVQDTSGHRRQSGDIVTLDAWFPERNQWRIKEAHADTGYRPWLYLDDIEPVEEPEDYEEVDVDRPEAGDIVTFTYLPMDEVVTTTVHESDFGPEMMGWAFFEGDTFADFDDDIKVTRVLRKVVPEPEPEIEEPPVGSIVRFENGVYAYRVRRGYTEEFPEDHDWRSLYSDGSTGLGTWESAKRYAGDDGKFEVIRKGGQGGDF